jgi:hypothetical protein
MVFGGSLNFSMGLYLGELILFGRVSIHLNAPSLGLIFGLSTVGSLFAIKWGPAVVRNHFKAALLVLPAAMGTAIIIASQIHVWACFLLALIVVEWGSSQSIQFMAYIRQTSTSPRQRGSIFGLLSSTNIVMGSVGILLSGVVSSRWGVPAAILTSGVGMLTLWAPALALRRAFSASNARRGQA